MIKDRKKKEILKFFETNGGLLYFYSASCGPCAVVDQILEKLIKIYNVTVFKVSSESDESEAWMKAWKIQQIPIVFALKEGQILSKVIGWTKESDFVDLIKMHL